MESLKQLVAIYKEIDVRMHAIYANVIHHRLTFEQGSAALQLPRDPAVSHPRYSPTSIGHDCHNLDPVAIALFPGYPESRLQAGWSRLFPLGAFALLLKRKAPVANRESGWLRTDQMRQLLPGAFRFFGELVIKVARRFPSSRNRSHFFIA
jgi:hypothetical protein